MQENKAIATQKCVNYRLMSDVLFDTTYNHRHPPLNCPVSFSHTDELNHVTLPS